MKNNPYIGPRPYQRGERRNFYGRNREARDLLSLIKAERVVLFYAQSGAGKTSLLNAQIIPALEDEFEVLPVARVGGDLPHGIDPGQVKNIFVYSALLGLAGQNVPADSLLGHTLLSFLRELVSAPKGHEPTPPILILDQFEEILTTHRDRWQEAQGFFLQLQEALRELPTLGVVLAMREDHLAGVEAHAPLLPKRLRARFRMELMRREGVLEAIKKPAAQANCPYDDGVAERLADDLSRIRLQRDSQETQEQTVIGPYVEPVQLQVVCQQLWENLPDPSDQAQHVITSDDVDKHGNVDRALIDFYESVVAQAVKETGAGERVIRAWFGNHLITPMQTRGLVMRGETETAGLPNAAVDLLEQRHLIRAEARAGARWYELSHDRLVEPLLQSNRAWEAARQTPLRLSARRWQESREISLLYRGKALNEALAWSMANSADVEPIELEFLDASRHAEKIRSRTRNLTMVGVVTVALVAIAMTCLAVVANQQRQIAVTAEARADQQRQIAVTAQSRAVQQAQTAVAAQIIAQEQGLARATAEAVAVEQRNVAQQQARVALSRQLAAQTIKYKADQLDLALLLSLEANRLNATAEVESSLLAGLTHSPRLSAFLNGHTGLVALSPDGKWLASGDTSGIIRLWDMAARQLVGEPLQGHDSRVLSLAYSPNGQLLASGGGDKRIIVWDVATRQPVGPPLTGHTDAVRSVAFSPDGKLLASGGYDNRVIFWDVTTRQPLVSPLANHAAYVLSVAFSPDGKTLASGSCGKLDETARCRQGEIRLWDVATRQPMGSPLQGHVNWVTSVTFSPDGKWLASASQDKSIIFWDMAMRQPSGPAISYTDVLVSAAFSPDGKLLAAAAADHSVILWDAKTRQVVSKLLGHTDDVRNVSFSRDGRLLASGSNTGLILWDMSIRQALGENLSGHSNEVFSVAISPDGRTLASGSCSGNQPNELCRPGEIRLWDARTRQPLGQPLAFHDGWVNALAFSPDSQTLASASDDKTIILLDVASRQRLDPPLIGHTNWVVSLAFAPDGRALASGGQDGQIIVWDTTTHQPLGAPMTGHTGSVRSVVFSPDGKLLASGSCAKPGLKSICNQGEIRLWDVTTRQLVAPPLIDHAGWVNSVAFSPDGKFLASGSDDSTIILWDVQSRRRLGVPLTGHSDAIWQVAFSPDGKILASGSDDNTVILWDVASRQQIEPALEGHQDAVLGIAYSPDSRSLASASRDHDIILWDVSFESWKARACHIANRNLTQDEWAQFIGPGIPYQKSCADLPPGASMQLK